MTRSSLFVTTLLMGKFRASEGDSVDPRRDLCLATKPSIASQAPMKTFSQGVIGVVVVVTIRRICQ